jgi:hypothetical protein
LQIVRISENGCQQHHIKDSFNPSKHCSTKQPAVGASQHNSAVPSPPTISLQQHHPSLSGLSFRRSCFGIFKKEKKKKAKKKNFFRSLTLSLLLSPSFYLLIQPYIYYIQLVEAAAVQSAVESIREGQLSAVVSTK